MTVRVHNYQERNGMSVCEDCGMVENKYAYGPRWCAGRLPSIEQREPVKPREAHTSRACAAWDNWTEEDVRVELTPLPKEPK